MVSFLLHLALFRKAAMILDPRTSPPRFHSHCFSSLTLGSVPIGFLCCESVLPSINRPWTERRVAFGRPDPTAQSPKFGIDP